MTSLHDELEKKLQDPNATPMSLPLEFLKIITCDFSTESELGRGGYGVVYKGVLRSGKIIAVKKLFETLLKHEAFQNEISFLMGIKHQNVVQFVGYCAESKWEAIEQPSGSGRHILAEIQKRLLCFEYVSNKSLDRHIADRSLDLEWNIRYKIIIGICNGLYFLHEECRIIHLDLKPENILMDSNMNPKIADFGLSRLFREQQSKVFTDNRAGTRGYMAPEYINQGLITKRADIFSLGVIIIEIVTGRREYPNFQLDSPESTATSCQHFTEEVLGSWRYKFESRVKFISMEKYIQQVKECISIALKCVDPGMEKRPTVKDVIQVLNAVDKVEVSKELPSEMQCMDKSQVLDTNASNEHILHSITEDMSNIKTGDTVGEVKKSQDCLLPTPLWTSSTSSQTHQEAAKESSEPQQSSDKTSELIPDSSMILDIHPLELWFFFEKYKIIPCSFDITNNTDEKMAFALKEKSSEETCFLRRWPTFGVVDPRTTYTLVLIMEKHWELPQQRNVDLILHTSTYCESSSDENTCIQHFQNAERLGITVHQVTLKCVCAPPRGVPIFEPIPPSIKIISMVDYSTFGRMIESVDANQTEPLIATAVYTGYVYIWNCDTQKYVGSIKIKEAHTAVRSFKFIARKGWLVVGTTDGFIRVYNYKKEMEETTSFKAGDEVQSLAIHPTKSFVLSACTTGIKLWDWDGGWFGWKCMRTFQEHSGSVRAVAFNPQDQNSFASASRDCTIKVWSLDSPKSKYTLYGHSSCVYSLDFFTRDGQQYLITGSGDKTAKVWDMHKKECAGTLPHNSAVIYVLSHPTLPVLVTGTEHGHVHLWNSITFRLKRILAIGSPSRVDGLACFNESGRVVVAHDMALSVIEIQDEEEQGGRTTSASLSSLCVVLIKNKVAMMKKKNKW
ncbi:uncharacterized protein [Lolium perenne]|uniref:uncharacterized protein isoform X2 n=1 Tax=Lolium perenne TaxID=4522 RepID=UPI0021F5A4C3|nr:uncharacterized protein LOC127319181 isoform X2 [Lolium perenne]